MGCLAESENIFGNLFFYTLEEKSRLKFLKLVHHILSIYYGFLLWKKNAFKDKRVSFTLKGIFKL